jgi:hypothetical protein
MKLFRDYGILASNLIELGALACQVDASFESAFKRPIVSLVKVVSYCLHKTLDKGPVRTSDWSDDLTPAQMRCTYSVKPGQGWGHVVSFSSGFWFGSDASNDVHSGFIVYKSLMTKAGSSRPRPRLMPERYTADLANELLGQRGDGRTRDGGEDDVSASTPIQGHREPPPLHVRAYTLWRKGHGLLDICIRMRDRANPQSETVVMYVCICAYQKKGEYSLN